MKFRTDLREGVLTTVNFTDSFTEQFTISLFCMEVTYKLL